MVVDDLEVADGLPLRAPAKLTSGVALPAPLVKMVKWVGLPTSTPSGKHTRVHLVDCTEPRWAGSLLPYLR